MPWVIGPVAGRRKETNAGSRNTSQTPEEIQGDDGQRSPVARPDQVYVCDITYIWTRESWLHLAVVIDLFSRKVVGWSMSSLMKGVWFAMHCEWQSGYASHRPV